MQNSVKYNQTALLSLCFLDSAALSLLFASKALCLLLYALLYVSPT